MGTSQFVATVGGAWVVVIAGVGTDADTVCTRVCYRAWIIVIAFHARTLVMNATGGCVASVVSTVVRVVAVKGGADA